MEEDALGKEIVQKLERLSSLRSPWLSSWQDCADFVLPRRSTQFQTTMSPAAPIAERIFDGTAPWANEQLAAGLHSYLTSTTQRWMKFKLADDSPYADDDDVVMWLDDCSNRLHNLLNNDKTQFVQQVHEMYLDLGALGTSIFYIEEEWDPRKPPLRFCTYHLGECYIQENDEGMVDTFYRDFAMAARNAVHMFGAQNVSPDIFKKSQDNPWDEVRFVHCLAPNQDFKSGLPRMGRNRPYISVYVEKEKRKTVRVGGYNRFPILAPRWSKLAGEVYGRSPAMLSMPDIRMVNEMAKTVIVAAQKIIDPPLQLPDEGFLLPIKTSPGGLNFYDSSLNPDHQIKPIETRGRVDIGEQLLQARRDHIIRAFYVDWMQMKETPRMSATEVLQRQEDRMRLMAPTIGRFQSEFLNPLVEYVFAVMNERGMLKEPPEHIQGAPLKVEYVSPVARAQRMSQMIAFQRLLESLGNIASFRPEVLDRIRAEEVPVYYAEMMDAPTKLLVSETEYQERRAMREQQQAAAAAAQTEVDRSAAAKNYAQSEKFSTEADQTARAPLRAVK